MRDRIGANFDEPRGPLTGLRLLLLEDEAMIALELEEMLRAQGADVVGPFSRVAEALEALRRESITGAVLDIQLNGEISFPVVDVLLERAKPILFVTGGALESIPEKYRQLPRVKKPFEYEEFAYLAESIFGNR
jgi:DNA-binding response OmpR family regulator